MATSIYWTDPDTNQVVTLVFDAVLSLNPEDTVTITDHTVEEGSDVTDNARSNSGRVSIEAIVSMTPNPLIDDDVSLVAIDLEAEIRAAAKTKVFTLDIPSPPVQFSETGLLNAGLGALGNALFGAPKATGLDTPGYDRERLTAKAYQQDSPRNRIRDFYDKVLKLKDDHVLVTMLSSHRDYFDYMLERVGKPQAATDGSMAKFQIDFKQIRTVSSASVTAPKPAETRGKLTVNKGAQGTKPGANAEKKVSLAKQGKNALGKLLSP